MSKCGQAVLFLTSVYFGIGKLILLFSYSFHMPYIIPSNVYFYIVRSMFSFLFSWSQSKASVVNLMSHLFFKLKITFCSFQLFENGHIHNVVSTLINVMKLYVENNSIVSTLSNVFNFNVEIGNVDVTLFNLVNFNTGIHNVVSKLIWHCPTSRYHITLTKTLSPCWMVSWVLANVAKRLHNFVMFFKIEDICIWQNIT